MIRGFRDKKTESVFSGEMVKDFSGFRKVAERKLTMLDSALDLKDLLSPAGNRLEKLRGDRVGQHSIRINDQLRIFLSGRLTDPMRSKSPIITEGDHAMNKNGMRPVHPGEILFEEFMKPSEPPINANILAKALEVPSNRVTAIIKGQRGITGDTAVRLATFFNTTAEFWMNLQKTYELRLAERAFSGKVIKHIEQHRDRLVSA
jgi:addiction module HigA family antidote